MALFFAVTQCRHGLAYSIESVGASLILAGTACVEPHCSANSRMWPLNDAVLGDLEQMLAVEHETILKALQEGR